MRHNKLRESFVNLFSDGCHDVESNLLPLQEELLLLNQRQLMIMMQNWTSWPTEFENPCLTKRTLKYNFSTIITNPANKRRRQLSRIYLKKQL